LHRFEGSDKLSQQDLDLCVDILDQFLNTETVKYLNYENIEGKNVFEANPYFMDQNMGYLQLFIKKGVDIRPKKTFENNNTLLHLVSGHHVLQLLIEIGYSVVLNQTNDNGDLPIHIVAKNAYNQHMSILIKAGSLVTQANKHKQTPLYLVCSPKYSCTSRGIGETVNLLIPHYSLEELQLLNKNGKTVVDLARDNNLAHIVHIIEKDTQQKQDLQEQSTLSMGSVRSFQI